MNITINEITNVNTTKITIIGAIILRKPFSFFLKPIKLKIKLSKPVIIAVKNNICMKTTIIPSGCFGAIA